MQSLKKQTFKTFQVIIVDDGSQPPIQPHGLTHGLDVTLVRHEANKGLSSARNTGVKSAKSKYIIFLDPDDLIEPHCLEKLLMAYWIWTYEDSSSEASGLGFVYPGTMQFQTGPSGEHMPYYYHAIPFTKRELLSLDCGFIPSFALIPRELYLEAGGMCNQVRGYEDYDFWLRLWGLGFHGKVLGERLFWYRRHNQGRTMEVESRELEWRDELKINNPRLFPHFIKESNEDYLDNDGPCYPKHRPKFTKVNFDLREFTHRNRRNFVYLMIPWMERGGAEQYELDVLEHCLQNEQIVVVTDTNSNHPWKHMYEAIPNVEIFQLEHFNLHSHIAVDYLFKSRPPKLVLIRNSWLGYEISSKYGNIIHFMDIQHLRNQRWQDLSADYSEYFTRHVIITPELLDKQNNKTVVVSPRVDKKVWKYGYRKSFPSEIFRVAFVGRIEEQKVPKKWTKITSHLHSWKKLVIGEGSLRRALEADVSYEWIDQPSVLKRILVEAPTVLLLTSRFEGVPIIVLQCVSAGIPVVAPDDLFLHLSNPLLVRYKREYEDSKVAEIVKEAIKLYFVYPQDPLYYDNNDTNEQELFCKAFTDI